ncbi:hypothetical protein [Actinosynnema pretiosum]|uniref:hypothetical protein n=1 Tax=Actinosynnema pretiosum TaxID=42197 RepID=UPI0012FD417C|nr:hypothetical protein [Actinosynnema pretiosum]
MDVVVKRVLLVVGVLLVPAGAAGFLVKSTLWRGQRAGSGSGSGIRRTSPRCGAGIW